MSRKELRRQDSKASKPPLAPPGAGAASQCVSPLPGNPKVVHHAFINIDETRPSRRLAAKQNPPGFDGMELSDTALMP